MHTYVLGGKTKRMKPLNSVFKDHISDTIRAPSSGETHKLFTHLIPHSLLSLFFPCANVLALVDVEYLQESSIFMEGFVRMGVTGAEGRGGGDCGGLSVGERPNMSPFVGLSLEPASFPFSLYRGSPGRGMGTEHGTKQTCDDGVNRKSKCETETSLRNRGGSPVIPRGEVGEGGGTPNQHRRAEQERGRGDDSRLLDGDSPCCCSPVQSTGEITMKRCCVLLSMRNDD